MLTVKLMRGGRDDPSMARLEVRAEFERGMWDALWRVAALVRGCGQAYAL